MVIALVIIIVVACAGGGGDETKQPSNVQGDPGTNSTTANNTGNENQNNDSNGSNPSVDVTLAETEVYNKDGIVITATKIEDDLFGPTVTFSITNDSSKNIVVTTRSLSVNGYMMEASVQEEKMFPVVMGIAIKKAYVNILFRFIVSSIRS